MQIRLMLLKNAFQALLKADLNASNISSNIVNFGCWTECWMHLRAYKRKKKTKIMLDNAG